MADMSAPATTTSTIYQSGGVTIISHPTFSDATSVISHALVPLAEETDGLTGRTGSVTALLYYASYVYNVAENSTEDCEEVTITFNPSTEVYYIILYSMETTVLLYIYYILSVL